MEGIELYDAINLDGMDALVDLVAENVESIFIEEEIKEFKREVAEGVTDAAGIDSLELKDIPKV